MSVRVCFFAAARAAAGERETTVDPAAPTLDAVLDVLRERYGPRLADVLLRCSFVVDETPAGRRAPADVPVPDGAQVEVLPPFAGG